MKNSAPKRGEGLRSSLRRRSRTRARKRRAIHRETHPPSLPSSPRRSSARTRSRARRRAEIRLAATFSSRAPRRWRARKPRRSRFFFATFPRRVAPRREPNRAELEHAAQLEPAAHPPGKRVDVRRVRLRRRARERREAPRAGAAPRLGAERREHNGRGVLREKRVERLERVFFVRVVARGYAVVDGVSRRVCE